MHNAPGKQTLLGSRGPSAPAITSTYQTYGKGFRKISSYWFKCPSSSQTTQQSGLTAHSEQLNPGLPNLSAPHRKHFSLFLKLLRQHWKEKSFTLIARLTRNHVVRSAGPWARPSQHCEQQRVIPGPQDKGHEPHTEKLCYGDSSKRHVLVSLAINCILGKSEGSLSSLRAYRKSLAKAPPGIKGPDMDHSLSIEGQQRVDTGPSQNRGEPLKMFMQHPSSKRYTGPRQDLL